MLKIILNINLLQVQFFFYFVQPIDLMVLYLYALKLNERIMYLSQQHSIIVIVYSILYRLLHSIYEFKLIQ